MMQEDHEAGVPNFTDKAGMPFDWRMMKNYPTLMDHLNSVNPKQEDLPAETWKPIPYKGTL